MRLTIFKLNFVSKETNILQGKVFSFIKCNTTNNVVKFVKIVSSCFDKIKWGFMLMLLISEHLNSKLSYVPNNNVSVLLC